MSHYSKPLHFADAFRVKLVGGAIFSAEVCEIVPRQRYKKRLSPENTTAFMQLSISKPDTRISVIADAVQSNVRSYPYKKCIINSHNEQLFNYNQSPYMIDTGMHVDP